jgi:hypothetical protein
VKKMRAKCSHCGCGTQLSKGLSSQLKHKKILQNAIEKSSLSLSFATNNACKNSVKCTAVHKEPNL